MSCNRDLVENSLGQSGFEFISDTVLHKAPSGTVFGTLVPSSDVVISAYTAESGALVTGNTFTGVSLPTGVPIYGRFTSITLTSGTLLAYKAV